VLLSCSSKALLSFPVESRGMEGWEIIPYLAGSSPRVSGAHLGTWRL